VTSKKHVELGKRERIPFKVLAGRGDEENFIHPVLREAHTEEGKLIHLLDGLP
jgi:hypothetical protein